MSNAKGSGGHCLSDGTGRDSYVSRKIRSPWSPDSKAPNRNGSNPPNGLLVEGSGVRDTWLADLFGPARDVAGEPGASSEESLMKRVPPMARSSSRRGRNMIRLH
eukprot:3940840-Rhodomonas_salina.4